MDRSTAYCCKSDLAHGRFDNEASLSVTLLHLSSTGSDSSEKRHLCFFVTNSLHHTVCDVPSSGARFGRRSTWSCCLPVRPLPARFPLTDSSDQGIIDQAGAVRPPPYSRHSGLLRHCLELLPEAHYTCKNEDFLPIDQNHTSQ